MIYRGFKITREYDHVVVTDLNSVDDYSWTEDNVDDAIEAIDEELDGVEN